MLTKLRKLCRTRLCKFGESWLTFAEPEILMALVLKICADAAIDRLRQRIRHRERHREMPVEPDAKEESPLNHAISRELRSSVLEAIERLPRNQAIAIVMRIEQDESHESIATALGCNEATARTHIARGRTRLQKLFVDQVESSSRSERRPND